MPVGGPCPAFVFSTIGVPSNICSFVAPRCTSSSMVLGATTMCLPLVRAAWSGPSDTPLRSSLNPARTFASVLSVSTCSVHYRFDSLDMSMVLSFGFGIRPTLGTCSCVTFHSASNAVKGFKTAPRSELTSPCSNRRVGGSAPVLEGLGMAALFCCAPPQARDSAGHRPTWQPPHASSTNQATAVCSGRTTIARHLAVYPCQSERVLVLLRSELNYCADQWLWLWLWLGICCAHFLLLHSGGSCKDNPQEKKNKIKKKTRSLKILKIMRMLVAGKRVGPTRYKSHQSPGPKLALELTRGRERTPGGPTLKTGNPNQVLLDVQDNAGKCSTCCKVPVRLVRS